MDVPFVHLDVRSCFSLKEGAYTPEQLVERTVALGMPAVALTDRDGLYGAARFVRACEQAGVRPILGASVTVRAPSATARRCARDPARRGCDRLREPVPAADRRAPARCTRRPVGRDRADLRACRRHDGAARATVPRRPSGSRRPHGRRGRACGAVPRSVRSRPGASSPLSIGSRSARHAELRAMLRFAERLDAPAIATNPVRYLVPEPTRSSPTPSSACGGSCRSRRPT